AILSVGDGLASQIPALLLSLSTGLIVTRGAVQEEDSDFGTDLLGQIRAQPKSMKIASAACAIFGIVPGMPHLPFICVAIALFVVSKKVETSLANELAETVAGATQPVSHEDPESPQSIIRSTRAERLELVIAPNLASLLMPERGGDLQARLRALRHETAAKMGFVLPTIRTIDDAYLAANTYVVRINAAEAGRGTVMVDHELVMGTNLDDVEGVPTREPSFGLPAKWVPVHYRERAMVATGMTPYPASSVLITHLAEIVTHRAGDLLSTQAVQQMLDQLKASDPALVEEMKGAALSLMELQRVLAALLSDRIPITDFVRIVEAVVSRCRIGQRSPEALIEAARAAVGPTITAAHTKDGVLYVVTLDATLESTLAGSLKPSDLGTVLTVLPDLTEHIVREMRALDDEATKARKEAVLLVGAALRPALARLFEAAIPRLAVVSMVEIGEIGQNCRLERVGVIGGVRATLDA
ncbi:MAG TPA: flagellar biosynthesis protein FlhA, partial [Acidimicrobiales bacterium]|nr:flagellar biosynthesis protein FlhA [Acidimicrobiales bacterium]